MDKAELLRAAERARYHARKQGNRCPTCGDATDGKRVYCDACSVYRNHQRKLSRQADIDARLCAKCRKPLDDGYSLINCPDCLKARAVYLREYRKRRNQSACTAYPPHQ